MPKLIIFVFLLNAIVFSSSSVFLDEFINQPRIDNLCDPVTACAAVGAGTAVPNPNNCNSYYHCVILNGKSVPSDSPIPCPKGQFFNSYLAKCEDEIEPCINTCAAISCATVCENLYDVVGFPGDCNKYYTCMQGGRKVENSCPADTPYFDGITCTTSSVSCCDFCTVICEEIDVQIADPYNCRMFYVCIETGTPSENYHLSCSDGYIFDADSRICITGDTCTDFCVASTTMPPEEETITTMPHEEEITTTTPSGGEGTLTTTLGGEVTTTVPFVEETTSTSLSGEDISTTTPLEEETTTTPSSVEETSTLPSGGETTTTTPSGEETSTIPSVTETITTTSSEPDTTTTTATATTSKTTTITTTLIPDATTTDSLTGKCPSTYTCTVDGNFPRCNFCANEYFNCNRGEASHEKCVIGTVFNTDPSYPYCILPENCPYQF